MEDYYPDWSIFGVPKNYYYIVSRSLSILLKRDGTKKYKDAINAQTKFGKRLKDYVDNNKIYVEYSDGPLQTGAYGQVARGTYERKPVVVKRVLKLEDLSVFLMEAVIQTIVRNAASLGVPQVYKFAKSLFPVPITRNGRTDVEMKTAYVMVMEEIKGPNLYDYDGDLETQVFEIIKGLKQLQDKVKFVHRDFHAGNIVIADKPYIIDFGMACVGGLNMRPFQNYIGDFATNCTNKSHDVCCLIVNLAGLTNTGSLQKTAKEICDAYKKVVTESPSVEHDNDTSLKQHHWKDDIFHWWYVTLLEDIQLKDYEPETFLKNHMKRICLEWKIQLRF